jgi:UTP--glucose-1-phosphate uridylyltransferase
LKNGKGEVMITKAIIPAGGLGTRFLPATKVIPKEMLPVLEKPAIQYVVEEGVKSSLKTFIIVTGKNKAVIEDHFDSSTDLQEYLESKKRGDLLEGINKIIHASQFIYLRQKEALGLGHAIWNAKHVIGKEHVAVLLPDDIIISPTPCIAQMMQIAIQEKCNVVAVQEVPVEQISNYGVIAVRKQFSPNLFQVKELVEKPKAIDAPSNLAIVGRYVLSPNIFNVLDEMNIGAHGEIELTDAIQAMLMNGEKVFAYKVQGTRYDVGTPMGLLKANLDMALRSTRYSEEMLDYLTELDREMLVMHGKAQSLAKLKPSSLLTL